MDRKAILSAISGALLPPLRKASSLSPVGRGRGWFPVFESYAGAWQRNVVVERDTVLSYHAVFSCITLIASDIAKLRMKLVERDTSGIWSEVESPAYSPVLRKPNDWQTRIQFWEQYYISKLITGNTYVLKQRDNRDVVAKMYVLDPKRVTPMVADDGSVFYQLQCDHLAGFDSDIMVPAREIIHDRFNCLFHPLVGVSPIFANGVAATQGLRIQNNSAQFFGNQSQPGGILTAPGEIGDDTAVRLKEYWETNFTGDKAGKIAVLGDDLKYQALTLSAQDSQLIEQLRWTAEVVCSTFHVPPYKIGVGQMPTYNNIQSLNVEYYSQCLQSHIEAAELCLDEGLGIGVGVSVTSDKGPPKTYGTEFDIEGLLRMDSVTQMEVLEKSKGVMTPNEQRRKLDLKPAKGGDSPMVQQQNYSLEALAKRDAQADPFGAAKPAAPAVQEPANDNADELEAAKALAELYKGFR